MKELIRKLFFKPKKHENMCDLCEKKRANAYGLLCDPCEYDLMEMNVTYDDAMRSKHGGELLER
jgi:hypothetical protein